MLIDLQKAFDTIDHEILLKKMGCIGFLEKVISWFLNRIHWEEHLKLILIKSFRIYIRFTFVFVIRK